MIEILKDYLSDWRTKKEILGYLSDKGVVMSERTLRQNLNGFNRQYPTGDTELFLAHSGKGYILTTDKSLIEKSLTDDRKRSLKMLKRYYGCLKELHSKNQLSLEPQDATLYEIVSKLGE